MEEQAIKFNWTLEEVIDKLDRWVNVNHGTSEEAWYYTTKYKAFINQQLREDMFVNWLPVFEEPGTFVSHGQVHTNCGFVTDLSIAIKSYTVKDLIALGATPNPAHVEKKFGKEFLEIMTKEWR